jgi:hypothetical protein
MPGKINQAAVSMALDNRFFYEKVSFAGAVNPYSLSVFNLCFFSTAEGKRL